MKEYVLKNDDFLVSQTDAKGRILFANDDFVKLQATLLKSLSDNPTMSCVIEICQKRHSKIYGRPSRATKYGMVMSKI